MHKAQPSVALVALASALLVAGCAVPVDRTARATAGPTTTAAAHPRPPNPAASGRQALPSSPRLGGMPADLVAGDVYSADRPGALSPAVQGLASRVYVPNSEGDSVDVLDPTSVGPARRFATGKNPQHVVPAYDLRTLWILNDLADTVTALDPRASGPGKVFKVTDPYNLYYTPDGRSAVVVAERLRRLDFRDPHNWRLQQTVKTPGCRGIDHADFTADGRSALFSCEFSRSLLRLDVATRRVTAVVRLPGAAGSSPQDVKLSPDGRVFYVADRYRDGVWIIDAATTAVADFLPTARGAHGLYVSRDSKDLYVSNRLGQSVSVVSFATRRVRATWRVPGGTPDMGGVSADGRVLWLSGRYSNEVYAIDITTGRLRQRIQVGRQPHGLAVFPQPGRYSLGHTGVYR